MLLGALILLPLVIYELRLSPQLHTKIYGWYPHDFIQTMRDGAYRPSVFMSHGLELAIWNAAAAFVGWQLYLRKALPKRLPFLPVPTLPALILLTLILARSHSSGALALFFIAMALFQLVVMLRRKSFLMILLVLPFAYMYLRGSGVWSGQNLVEISVKFTGSAERGRSLTARLDNEKILVEKACLRLPFGWGPYQRSFVVDSYGNYISVPDGRWVVILGENGLFGLLSFSIFMMLPALLYFMRCSVAELASTERIAASAFATFMGITMIDNMFNAMGNPVLIVAAGGLLTLVLSPSAFSATRRDENIKANSLILVPTTRTI
jgi:hypothetical protein